MHSFITRVCQNTEHAKLHCTKIVTTKNWKNDAVVTFTGRRCKMSQVCSLIVIHEL